MGRRAQGTEITLRGGPAGEFSRGLVTGTFPHRGPVENHGGGGAQSPGTLIIERGLWEWGSLLSMGAL